MKGRYGRDRYLALSELEISRLIGSAIESVLGHLEITDIVKIPDEEGKTE